MNIEPNTSQQPPARTPLQAFLQELDEVLDQDGYAPGNTEIRKANTKALLEEANLLWKNSPLEERFKDGSLHKSICGSTSVPETVGENIIRRPVVDLVQQGGTMLGIGLLGYTYILEKAGIRFRNMAGTSAGAINTLLLSALPEKVYKEKSVFYPEQESVKSELLAYLVANEDFLKFLDRQGFMGRVQRFLMRRIKVMAVLMKLLKFVLPLGMVAISYLIYHSLNRWLFNSANHLTEKEINTYNFITGTFGIMLVLLLFLVIIFNLFKQRMGFNPGEKPYNWLKSILETKYVDIKNTEELTLRKKLDPLPTYVPPLNTKALEFKDPRLVFIAANLTHNRIVKFPENSTDYWNKDFHDKVSPAAFVRASMSLPFIFHAFIPGDDYVEVRTGQHPKGTVDMLARFVDGGLLSNFPIREFHTPPGVDPRYPTFGVLLGNLPREPGKDTETIRNKFYSLSVFKFIVSFISTFRNFYDADFLRNHKEFHMLVKSVNTDKFNSLDFGMKFDTKKELFAEGAKTAIEHLKEFDWEKYLAVRKETS